MKFKRRMFVQKSLLRMIFFVVAIIFFIWSVKSGDHEKQVFYWLALIFFVICGLMLKRPLSQYYYHDKIKIVVWIVLICMILLPIIEKLLDIRQYRMDYIEGVVEYSLLSIMFFTCKAIRDKLNRRNKFAYLQLLFEEIVEECLNKGIDHKKLDALRKEVSFFSTDPRIWIISWRDACQDSQLLAHKLCIGLISKVSSTDLSKKFWEEVVRYSVSNDVELRKLCEIEIERICLSMKKRVN